MKTSITLNILIGLSALIAVTAAHADDTTTTAAPAGDTASATTSATASVPSASILDDFYVNYFGIYHGAALNNLGSQYTVDQTGKQSHTGIYFDSEITTAYMITKDIGIGPDIAFAATPVMGQGLTMEDSGIKVFDRKTIATDNFTLYTNFYVQAATLQYDATRGMNVGLKMTPYVMYHLAGTRWTFGTWSEEKLYQGVAYGKQVKFYALPYVNYQIAPKFSANLGYEMETDHNVGTPGFQLTSYETDLQPGFVWNITPKILLNPYVQLFTGNRVGMDTTAVGAVINATVL